MASIPNTRFRVIFKNDKGLSRSNNEDNLIVNLDLTQNDWTAPNDAQTLMLGPNGSVLVVADGMGGTNAGEVASQQAVEAIRNFFSQPEVFQNPAPDNLLKQAILHANQRIGQYAREHPEAQGMGTTCTIAWLLNGVAHIAWIGDSRAYLLRQDRLIQLSRDHSLVQELVDAGKLTEEQAFYHPDKNIIVQSLGLSSKHPEPGYHACELAGKDRLLLCTDGLNSMLRDDQIQAVLQTNGDTRACVDDLVKAANEAGGYDNITIILCDVESAPAIRIKSGIPPAPAPPPSPGSKSRKTIHFGIRTAILLITLLTGYLIWQKTGKGPALPGEPNAAALPDTSGSNTVPSSSDRDGLQRNISKNKSPNDNNAGPATSTVNPDNPQQTNTGAQTALDSLQKARLEKGLPELVKENPANNKPAGTVKNDATPDKRDADNAGENKANQPSAGPFHVVESTYSNKENAEKRVIELKGLNMQDANIRILTLNECSISRTDKISPCFKIIINSFLKEKLAKNYKKMLEKNYKLQGLVVVKIQ